MKPFWSGLVATALAVVGLIYWVDPTLRWHARSSFPANGVQAGQVWLPGGLNTDERTVKLAFIRSIPKPDLVVFGSSRVARVTARELIRSDVRTFNAGVFSASLLDFVGLWQALKESEKIPGRAILCVDPWMMNAGFKGSLWRRERRLVKAFGAKPFDGDSDWDSLIFETKQLFSFQMLEASLKSIWRHRSDQRERSFVALENAVPPRESGYRADGSGFGPSEMDLGRTIENARQIARHEASRTRNFNQLYEWRSDPARTASLRALLDDLDRHHVQTLVVLLPFHPDSYRLWMEDPDSRGSFEEFRRSMSADQALRDNTAVCDLMDPSRAGCSDADFEDSDHFSQRCYDRVLHTCLTPFPEWKAVLREDPPKPRR